MIDVTLRISSIFSVRPSPISYSTFTGKQQIYRKRNPPLETFSTQLTGFSTVGDLSCSLGKGAGFRDRPLVLTERLGLFCKTKRYVQVGGLAGG